MQALKEIIETIVNEQSKGVKDVALLLSGGVDSLSCDFAAHDLGMQIHAYTFQVGEWSSEDSRSAERAARLMGWRFTLIKVPIDNLEADFLKLARVYKCQKKTQFECTFPFLYLVPAITERVVLSGIAADGHFGLSKKAMIHYRHPKSKFDEFRRAYFSAANPAGQLQQKQLLGEYGKMQIAPYLDRRVFDYFMAFDWDQINKPIQKIKTLQAWPNYFKRVGRRPHQNLQLTAGVDTIFLQLLNSPLNTKKRTRIMDLCRDYAIGQPVGTDDDD